MLAVCCVGSWGCHLKGGRLHSHDGMCWFLVALGANSDSHAGATCRKNNFIVPVLSKHQYLTKQNDSVMPSLPTVEAAHYSGEEPGSTTGRHRYLCHSESTASPPLHPNNDTERHLSPNWVPLFVDSRWGQLRKVYILLVLQTPNY